MRFVLLDFKFFHNLILQLYIILELFFISWIVKNAIIMI